MRISQMKARENFDEILVNTLARGWSQQFNRTVEVHLKDADSLDSQYQAWHLHPLLSMFCSNEPTDGVRRFLRDSFRVSPIFWRVVPRWILGTAATTSLGLRLGGK